MVLRDLGLAKSPRVVTPVAKRPKSEELLTAGRGETSECRGYHVVQVSHDACKLLISGPSRLVIWSRPSGARGEESHDKRRYSRGRPVGAILFEQQTLPGVLVVFCDADHWGDLGTRKSRSGTAVMWCHT